MSSFSLTTSLKLVVVVAKSRTLVIGVAFGLALLRLAGSAANAQEIIDESDMSIWVVSRSDVLAAVRKQLPDPEHARIRGLTQVSSHTACGEVSYAAGVESFKRFCFGLVGGTSF